MKFAIKRSAFLQQLNNVQRAISTKTTIPILTGLKLELTADKLTLTGSDADISIQTVISTTNENAQLEILQPGSVVLPARFFSEIVKKLPTDNFSIEVNENLQTTILSGPASFTVNGLDAVEYPHLPEVESSQQLTLPADLFKKVINQTTIAASDQESRPILTGVHLVIENQQLTAVATDSHRLSQRKIPLENQTASYDIIVPSRSLIELAKMLPDSTTEIELRISENQILCSFAQTVFYSRLLEGNYPDTTQLIPQNSETELEVNAVEFLAAIERASLLSHEGNYNIVKLTLAPEQQTAQIFGNTPEIGNVEEKLKFQKLTGKELEISFNPDYMKDALRSFGQSTVKIDFTQPLRPFILIPSENKNDFIQLITPVRTF
ncbi:MAG: DNA polymerase III subunit beta [Liquorilactobacillus nagelii]|jgi:DNA polymerase-3 subunit beta|uniref:Beta sliding clamp n=1 Tax=Liquorilactobacillus nagelii TaxID=82688 RepID=A0A3S6QSQ5_9LACO|nr:MULTISPECIES: DNA polymerase III subunit beta [Lactobacillales]AUJ31093.1 DNA polymerase III subunit beta [Liquorilactobacillus nagelii]KRL42272.1 DNA polymerase III, beta chain [Liquorilactobacillus nagelii DSM 13675]MCC7616507.1 DNA polymerase III subunit beta [Liquorilactobacillus nagelii]MCI1699001.1 DNA polymerase III subunit beta [Liquorilactobacillus nagelii]MCI1819967.1 DNA polymerase III subunit beta [Carnobacterium maltaromaticum]